MFTLGDVADILDDALDMGINIVEALHKLAEAGDKGPVSKDECISQLEMSGGARKSARGEDSTMPSLRQVENDDDVCVEGASNPAMFAVRYQDADDFLDSERSQAYDKECKDTSYDWSEVTKFVTVEDLDRESWSKKLHPENDSKVSPLKIYSYDVNVRDGSKWANDEICDGDNICDSPDYYDAPLKKYKSKRWSNTFALNMEHDDFSPHITRKVSNSASRQSSFSGNGSSDEGKDFMLSQNVEEVYNSEDDMPVVKRKRCNTYSIESTPRSEAEDKGLPIIDALDDLCAMADQFMNRKWILQKDSAENTGMCYSSEDEISPVASKGIDEKILALDEETARVYEVFTDAIQKKSDSYVERKLDRNRSREFVNGSDLHDFVDQRIADIGSQAEIVRESFKSLQQLRQYGNRKNEIDISKDFENVQKIDVNYFENDIDGDTKHDDYKDNTPKQEESQMSDESVKFRDDNTDYQNSEVGKTNGTFPMDEEREMHVQVPMSSGKNDTFNEIYTEMEEHVPCEFKTVTDVKYDYLETWTMSRNEANLPSSTMSAEDATKKNRPGTFVLDVSKDKELVRDSVYEEPVFITVKESTFKSSNDLESDEDLSQKGSKQFYIKDGGKSTSEGGFGEENAKTLHHEASKQFDVNGKQFFTSQSGLDKVGAKVDVGVIRNSNVDPDSDKVSRDSNTKARPGTYVLNKTNQNSEEENDSLQQESHGESGLKRRPGTFVLQDKDLKSNDIKYAKVEIDVYEPIWKTDHVTISLPNDSGAIKKTPSTFVLEKSSAVARETERSSSVEGLGSISRGALQGSNYVKTDETDSATRAEEDTTNKRRKKPGQTRAYKSEKACPSQREKITAKDERKGKKRVSGNSDSLECKDQYASKFVGKDEETKPDEREICQRIEDTDSQQSERKNKSSRPGTYVLTKPILSHDSSRVTDYNTVADKREFENIYTDGVEASWQEKEARPKRARPGTYTLNAHMIFQPVATDEIIIDAKAVEFDSAQNDNSVGEDNHSLKLEADSLKESVLESTDVRRKPSANKKFESHTPEVVKRKVKPRRPRPSTYKIDKALSKVMKSSDDLNTEPTSTFSNANTEIKVSVSSDANKSLDNDGLSKEVRTLVEHPVSTFKTVSNVFISKRDSSEGKGNHSEGKKSKENNDRDNIESELTKNGNRVGASNDNEELVEVRKTSFTYDWRVSEKTFISESSIDYKEDASSDIDNEKANNERLVNALETADKSNGNNSFLVHADVPTRNTERGYIVVKNYVKSQERYSSESTPDSLSQDVSENTLGYESKEQSIENLPGSVVSFSEEQVGEDFEEIASKKREEGTTEGSKEEVVLEPAPTSVKEAIAEKSEDILDCQDEILAEDKGQSFNCAENGAESARLNASEAGYIKIPNNDCEREVSDDLEVVAGRRESIECRSSNGTDLNSQQCDETRIENIPFDSIKSNPRNENQHKDFRGRVIKRDWFQDPGDRRDEMGIVISWSEKPREATKENSEMNNNDLKTVEKDFSLNSDYSEMADECAVLSTTVESDCCPDERFYNGAAGLHLLKEPVITRVKDVNKLQEHTSAKVKAGQPAKNEGQENVSNVVVSAAKEPNQVEADANDGQADTDEPCKTSFNEHDLNLENDAANRDKTSVSSVEIVEDASDEIQQIELNEESIDEMKGGRIAVKLEIDFSEAFEESRLSSQRKGTAAKEFVETQAGKEEYEDSVAFKEEDVFDDTDEEDKKNVKLKLRIDKSETAADDVSRRSSQGISFDIDLEGGEKKAASPPEDLKKRLSVRTRPKRKGSNRPGTYVLNSPIFSRDEHEDEEEFQKSFTRRSLGSSDGGDLHGEIKKAVEQGRLELKIDAYEDERKRKSRRFDVEIDSRSERKGRFQRDKQPDKRFIKRNIDDELCFKEKLYTSTRFSRTGDDVKVKTDKGDEMSMYTKKFDERNDAQYAEIERGDDEYIQKDDEKVVKRSSKRSQKTATYVLQFEGDREKSLTDNGKEQFLRYSEGEVGSRYDKAKEDDEVGGKVVKKSLRPGTYVLHRPGGEENFESRQEAAKQEEGETEMQSFAVKMSPREMEKGKHSNKLPEKDSKTERLEKFRKGFDNQRIGFFVDLKNNGENVEMKDSKRAEIQKHDGDENLETNVRKSDGGDIDTENNECLDLRFASHEKCNNALSTEINAMTNICVSNEESQNKAVMNYSTDQLWDDALSIGNHKESDKLVKGTSEADETAEEYFINNASRCGSEGLERLNGTIPKANSEAALSKQYFDLCENHKPGAHRRSLSSTVEIERKSRYSSWEITPDTEKEVLGKITSLKDHTSSKSSEDGIYVEEMQGKRYTDNEKSDNGDEHMCFSSRSSANKPGRYLDDVKIAPEQAPRQQSEHFVIAFDAETVEQTAAKQERRKDFSKQNDESGKKSSRKSDYFVIGEEFNAEEARIKRRSSEKDRGRRASSEEVKQGTTKVKRKNTFVIRSLDNSEKDLGALNDEEVASTDSKANETVGYAENAGKKQDEKTGEDIESKANVVTGSGDDFEGNQKEIKEEEARVSKLNANQRVVECNNAVAERKGADNDSKSTDQSELTGFTKTPKGISSPENYGTESVYVRETSVLKPENEDRVTVVSGQDSRQERTCRDETIVEDFDLYVSSGSRPASGISESQSTELANDRRESEERASQRSSAVSSTEDLVMEEGDDRNEVSNYDEVASMSHRSLGKGPSMGREIPRKMIDRQLSDTVVSSSQKRTTASDDEITNSSYEIRSKAMKGIERQLSENIQQARSLLQDGKENLLNNQVTASMPSLDGGLSTSPFKAPRTNRRQNFGHRPMSYDVARKPLLERLERLCTFMSKSLTKLNNMSEGESEIVSKLDRKHGREDLIVRRKASSGDIECEADGQGIRDWEGEQHRTILSTVEDILEYDEELRTESNNATEAKPQDSRLRSRREHTYADNRIENTNINEGAGVQGNVARDCMDVKTANLKSAKVLNTRQKVPWKAQRRKGLLNQNESAVIRTPIALYF